MIIPGDITRNVVQQLAERYPQWLDDDILVVPHHGSTTSSSGAFIAAVSTEYGLIAAGYRNRYGLPAARFVQRYREAGVKLLNTAESGAVSVSLGPGGARFPVSWRSKARRFWHYP